MIFSSFTKGSHYKRKRRKKYTLIRRLSKVILFLLLISTLRIINAWIGIQSYYINSKSMENTLQTGDRIIALPAAYGLRMPFGDNRHFFEFRQPTYGDMVLVRSAKPPVSILKRSFDYLLSLFFLAPLPTPYRYSVRRIVALPGDTITLTNFRAFIQPKGSERTYREELLSKKKYSLEFHNLNWPDNLPFSGSSSKKIQLAENEYFLLADKRDSSLDSWQLAPVKKADLVALLVLRFWPFNRLTMF